MRQAMRELRKRLGLAIAAIVALLVIGTFAYSSIEGWRLIDSFYFIATTLTTVGLGDFVPTHDVSKLFTVFFVFAGVGIMLYSLSVIADSLFRKGVRSIESHNHNGSGKAGAK